MAMARWNTTFNFIPKAANTDEFKLYLDSSGLKYYEHLDFRDNLKS